VDANFVLDLGKIGDTVKLLLDIDRMLGNGDGVEFTGQTTPSDV